MEMKIHGQKLKSKHNKNRSRRKTSLVSVNDPKAPFSYVEAYKTLRTNLEFINGAGKVKSIVVTSALPEESKSTVSINLAMSLGNSSKSVILVECDLRKPTLRHYLKLERNPNGLSAVLAGNAEIDDCIQTIDALGISVLPAGTIPPNPSELLNQQRMADLVGELKERFDYVILDAPPVTLVTDAAVVGRIADGALLVVRSKYASTKTVRMALHQLKAVKINVLGAVLTRYTPKKSTGNYQYDYDYEYGYRHHQGDV